MNLAILQARMSSTRLPGKVLRKIEGVPMLVRQLQRLSGCRNIDLLVVATSLEEDDSAIVEVCSAENVQVRRGPLNDVLERFRLSAEEFSPEHVVRLTADCPLIDSRVVDDLIDLHILNGFDYTTNSLSRTFPHGLDCEVMTWMALKRAASLAKAPAQREHVTPYLYDQANGFRVGHLLAKEDLSFLRWTVDTPEDFALVEGVYRGLYASKSAFETEDVIAFLGAHRELRFINANRQTSEQRQRAEAFWKSYDVAKRAAH